MTDIPGSSERVSNLISGVDFTRREVDEQAELDDGLALSTADQIGALGTPSEQPVETLGNVGSEPTAQVTPVKEKLRHLEHLDSVPALERIVRGLEARLAPDQDRLEKAISTLEEAIGRFDGAPDDSPRDRARHAFILKQLDPDETFVEAYADYTAAAITMFRDLHPVGREGSVTFFETVVAKLAKREERYGRPVPAIMRELGIDVEPAFEEARLRDDAKDRATREVALLQTAAEVSLFRSVDELAEESTYFYEKTGRPFSGVLAQMRGEIAELREALGEVSINDLLVRLRERHPESPAQNWRRQSKGLSAVEIVEAEKSGDPLFALSGELADIFIAGLDIADSFRPKASEAIIRSIHQVIREDSRRERPPVENWLVQFPVDRAPGRVAIASEQSS